MDPTTESNLLRSAEGRRAADILEWDRLLDDVAGLAALERAAAAVRASVPIDDVSSRAGAPPSGCELKSTPLFWPRKPPDKKEAREGAHSGFVLYARVNVMP